MNLRNLTLLLACSGLAAVAFAGEEPKTRMAVTISDDSAAGDVHFELDSDDLGFNLHDMQEGENRSVVDKSGRSILITREANGFRFDVDGKSIEMPLFGGTHHGHSMAHDGEYGNSEFHVMRKIGMDPAHKMDGVTIISEKDIDEATQQAIRSLLESAGHSNDVRFIGQENGHGGVRRIKIVEKNVAVAE